METFEYAFVISRGKGTRIQQRKHCEYAFVFSRGKGIRIQQRKRIHLLVGEKGSEISNGNVVSINSLRNSRSRDPDSASETLRVHLVHRRDEHNPDLAMGKVAGIRIENGKLFKYEGSSCC